MGGLPALELRVSGLGGTAAIEVVACGMSGFDRRSDEDRRSRVTQISLNLPSWQSFSPAAHCREQKPDPRSSSDFNQPKATAPSPKKPPTTPALVRADVASVFKLRFQRPVMDSSSLSA